MAGTKRTVGTSFDDLLRQVQEARAGLTLAVDGDLAGSLPSPTVKGLRGRTVAATAPTAGQGLVWDGGQWAPASVGALTWTPVEYEVPIGTINSANRTFTLAFVPVDGVVHVVLNGVERFPDADADFTVDAASKKVIFTDNCVPQRGSSLWVHYRRAAT